MRLKAGRPAHHGEETMDGAACLEWLPSRRIGALDASQELPPRTGRALAHLFGR